MDNDKPEECKVCFNNYDKELRRPRTLPCGHTFCSQCIKDKIKNVQLTCPSCHVEHSAKDINQFPINYIVETFIRKLRDNQLTSVGAVSRKRGQDNTRGTSKKLRSLVQEIKSTISNLINECEETLSQLGMYQGQLRDWKTQHHQLQDRLYGLLEKNKAAIELLEQEDTSVVNMTTEGEAGKKQLQTMPECFNTVNNPQVTTTNDETDHYNFEVEDWIQKCQELFPDVNTVCTSVKVQETIKALETIKTETGATAATVFLGDSAATIMETVKKITDEIVLEILTVDHLRGMSESVKRLVQAGLVLGVHQDQDGLRYSRITLQGGQLFLHTLQQEPPPTLAHTLQVREVLEALDHTSTLVFLDLTWPGSPRRRLHIQLNGDTMMARQFVLLCTGQHSGYSYLNTNLIKVSKKGKPGESVLGGASLLFHKDDHLYEMSDSAGAVGSVGSVVSGGSMGHQGSDLSAMFIITRDLTDGLRLPNVFGKVVKGLDVVRAAVNHRNITEVTVVDCGVVLTL